jgi:hypothetical protein
MSIRFGLKIGCDTSGGGMLHGQLAPPSWELTDILKHDTKELRSAAVLYAAAVPYATGN